MDARETTGARRLADLVTFNTHRRLTALGLMREHGIDDLGSGCPMECESTVAPWKREA
jgi:hypothetical protein